MNWGEMMRLAVRLGVTPERFWRLSMREWRWLASPGQAPAMTRAELERLAGRWPDGGTRPETGLAPATENGRGSQ